jgi:hypothetical protein
MRNLLKGAPVSKGDDSAVGAIATIFFQLLKEIRSEILYSGNLSSFESHDRADTDGLGVAAWYAACGVGG